jgi:hypothetical protein
VVNKFSFTFCKQNTHYCVYKNTLQVSMRYLFEMFLYSCNYLYWTLLNSCVYFSQSNVNYSLWNMSVCIRVRFEFFTAIFMKMAVFWDVIPCNLLDINRCFREAYRLLRQVELSSLHSCVSQKNAIFMFTEIWIKPFFINQNSQYLIVLCLFLLWWSE